MTPMVQDMLMSLLRKALVALGAVLVQRGWFEQGEWEAYIPGLTGLVLVAGGSAWSLVNKYRSERKKLL